MTSLITLGYGAWVIDPAERPLVEALEELRPDLCWPVLHGKEGEDGTVQRLLDLLDLPYTGTAAFDCEVAFDKVLAKDALRRAGIPTPDWVTVEGWALRDLGAGAALDRALDRVGVPAVVKPSRSGSALGVGFVARSQELSPALMAALSFSGAAVIEAKVEGTEVACSLLGPDMEAMPLVEIVPKDGVYDYAARYTAGATDYFAPARVDPDVAAAVVEAASRAAATFGLRDVTRVDAIVDRDGRPWILEVNVAPGMTETSLLPMAAQAAGLALPDVCERIMRGAMARRSP